MILMELEAWKKCFSFGFDVFSLHLKHALLGHTQSGFWIVKLMTVVIMHLYLVLNAVPRNKSGVRTVDAFSKYFLIESKLTAALKTTNKLDLWMTLFTVVIMHADFCFFWISASPFTNWCKTCTKSVNVASYEVPTNKQATQRKVAQPTYILQENWFLKVLASERLNVGNTYCS